MNDGVWKVFIRSGIVGVIAGVLLWVFIQDVRADQKATRAEHTSTHNELQALKNVLGQAVISQERMVYLTRQQCFNTARSDEQRRACARDKD